MSFGVEVAYITQLLELIANHYITLYHCHVIPMNNPKPAPPSTPGNLIIPRDKIQARWRTGTADLIISFDRDIFRLVRAGENKMYVFFYT